MGCRCGRSRGRKAPLSDEGVLRYAGTAYDERHPGGLLVGLLLLRQPVLSKHIPIIRREPDVGVCELTRIRESRKGFVHGVIHITNLFQLALIQSLSSSCFRPPGSVMFG